MFRRDSFLVSFIYIYDCKLNAIMWRFISLSQHWLILLVNSSKIYAKQLVYELSSLRTKILRLSILTFVVWDRASHHNHPMEWQFRCKAIVIYELLKIFWPFCLWKDVSNVGKPIGELRVGYAAPLNRNPNSCRTTRPKLKLLKARVEQCIYIYIYVLQSCF